MNADTNAQAAETKPGKKFGLLADHLTDSEFCAEFEITARTARKWRGRPDGPPHICIGRTVLYPRDALLEWLRKRATTHRRAKPLRTRCHK